MKNNLGINVTYKIYAYIFFYHDLILYLNFCILFIVYLFLLFIRKYYSNQNLIETLHLVIYFSINLLKCDPNFINLLNSRILNLFKV